MTVGRRDAAVEPTWMYLRRVMKRLPGPKGVPQTGPIVKSVLAFGTAIWQACVIMTEPIDIDSLETFMARLARLLPPPGPARWFLLPVYVLALLVLLYAVGRPIHVWLGNFYSGPRAPYLQMPAATAITLRWQTPQAETGVVRYGLRPDRLDHAAREAEAGEAHRVRLTGLQPDTRYYYAVGNPQGNRYAGDDYTFRTLSVSLKVPVRFAVLGDPGDPTPLQKKARDALIAWLEHHARPGRPRLDLLLTTGDNAYTSGTNTQFQKDFFGPYAELLRHVPVIPAYGNHDARRYIFFKLFDFPTHGESGGVPSGTEHWFSLNDGPLHLVMLDSATESLDSDHPMLDWLRRDLAANDRPWTVAVMHHPPYTHGSHNSDRRCDSHGRMFAIRKYLLPVLEAGGVDLVLAGHSHMYERSHLLDCHYATSSRLDRKASLRPPEAGTPPMPYRKRPGPHSGTIYAVVGSSSKVDQGPLDHPVMAVSEARVGVLVVDIAGNTLTGRYLRADGSLGDRFRLIRDANAPPFHNGCQ